MSDESDVADKKRKVYVIPLTLTTLWLEKFVTDACRARKVTEAHFVREAIMKYLADEEPEVARLWSNWKEMHGTED